MKLIDLISKRHLIICIMMIVLGCYAKQSEWSVKDGCFKEDNNYTFLLAPWSTLSLPSKLPDRRGPWSQHRMYHEAPDKSLLEELGFNSIQMNHFMTYPMMKKLYPQLLKAKKIWYGQDYFPNAEKLCAGVLKRIEGTPIIMDWGDMGTHLGFGKRAHKVLKDKRYFQKTSWWTGFMPLDPSYPPAMKLLEFVYKDSTEFILKNGGNPLIYELLNEPFYNSFSHHNLAKFSKYLKSKYGSIRKLNNKYGTSWSTIEEGVNKVETQQDLNPGLWVDWMEFSNKIMTGYLKTFKKLILEVDKRPVKKYFCVQPQHNISEMAYNNSFSMLNHDFLDVIGLEYCGLNFGSHHIGHQKLTDMMEAGFKTSTGKILTAMGIAKAYAKGRPIVDLEVSCARYRNGLRVPSRVGDLETVLWHQLMNDVSGSMFYCFSGRSWEWGNMKQAKRSARSAHYKAHMLLNPFNYPVECLSDFKKFQTRFSQLSDLLSPTPRVKGNVGILYLGRQIWLSKGNEWQRYETYNSSLNSIHMPADFIIAEKLTSEKELSKYPILFCPQLTYCSPEIKHIIDRYVKAGGIVVTAADSFTHDDYGKKTVNTNILGLHSKALKEKSDKLKNFQHNFLRKWHLSLSTAQPFLKWKDDKTAVAVNSSGKGKIYTLGMENGNALLGSIFKMILDRNNVYADNMLALKYSPQLSSKVTMNMIKRNNKRFYYFLNWNKISDVGILKPAAVSEGSYYVYDVTTWKCLRSPSNEDTWTSRQIMAGIPVFLPTELRALILITPQKSPYHQQTYTLAELKKQAELRRSQDLKTLKHEALLVEQKRAELFANRTFPQVISDKVFTVDLKPYVTTSFTDKISNDGQGGWTDQGELNDLSSIPLGQQTFYGVPYEIINPALNNGKSCIVLKGRERQRFPLAVKGIKVNKKVRSLYFLHTMGWKAAHLMDYIIHYSDKTQTVIPIRQAQEIGGWWKPADAGLEGNNVKIAWLGTNKGGQKVGVYTFRWKNPYPDKTLESIDVISKATAVPAILAITGATEEQQVKSPVLSIMDKKLHAGIKCFSFHLGKLKKSLENNMQVLSAETIPTQKWGGIIFKTKRGIPISKEATKLCFELNYAGVDPYGSPAAPTPLQVILRTDNAKKSVKRQLKPLDLDKNSWQAFNVPLPQDDALKEIVIQFRSAHPKYGKLAIRNIYLAN